jgi:hypothetical protein
MKKNLSPEMHRCFTIVKLSGSIIRYPGGYWQKPDDPCVKKFADGERHPDDWVTAGTVHALVKRGLLRFSKRRLGPHGRFPIAAVFTMEGEKYTPPPGDKSTGKQLSLFD